MKFLFVTVNLFILFAAKAQDPRFSQFFMSPLSLNPALTANIDGDIRFSSIYRNQWRQLGSSYNTAAVSLDGRLMKNVISESNRFGAGLFLMYDESFGAAYKINHAAFSTAYHQAINYEGTSTIGVGIQAVYASRRINLNKLTFSNQFTTGGFDLDLPSGENFQNDLKPFVDVNAGILFNHRSDNLSFYLGGAGYNLSSPVQSLTGDQSSRIPARYIIHGGLALSLNEEGNTLLGSFSAMQQAGVNDFNLGAAYGINLSGSSANNYLYLGGFFRFLKSAYPYVALRIADFQFGLTYDVELFDIAKINRNTGSFELSLSYSNTSSREEIRSVPWY